MSQVPMAKVLFRVPEDDGGATVETLWAVPLGDDRYKLDNSPFYAYGVSWEDVVYAPADPQEQMPTFKSVVERSGNRTVRVIFETPISPGNASDQVLQGLVAMGCSYEGANPKYVSINVPPAVELQKVRPYLIERNALTGFPPGVSFSIERDLFPRLVGNLGAYRCRLPFTDIGTVESLQAFRDSQR